MKLLYTECEAVEECFDFEEFTRRSDAVGFMALEERQHSKNSKACILQRPQKVIH